MFKKLVLLMGISAILMMANLIMAATDDILIVADFNSNKRFNNLGGEFGSWQVDPKDESQSCTMNLDEVISATGSKGYFVRLEYDVDSLKPAFNGFWMKLSELDLTPYEYLSFLVKGEVRFTEQFKVELKNTKGKKVIYFISGVSDSWQRFVIPLEKLKKVNSITDWTRMSEFTIIFDDIVATDKNGTILIDDITFTKFNEESDQIQ